MIEHLDGIHETVTYKENSSLRLFVNTDCETIPFTATPMEIIMPLEGLIRFSSGINLFFFRGRHYFHLPWILHSCGTENGKRIILQIEWSVVSKIRDLNSILALISRFSLLLLRPLLTSIPIFIILSARFFRNMKRIFLSEAVIYARMLDILSDRYRYQAFASCRFDAGPQSRKNIWIVFFPSAIILMNTARKIFP